MDFDGSGGNAAFTKRALTFSIMGMVLMAGFLAVFLPNDYDGDMKAELDTLSEGYYSMTGTKAASEEIWGLTGIYSPYGMDTQGNTSTQWGTTPDGWVYGERKNSYSPSQYEDLNGGKESYTVQYDPDKGLYYYTEKGSDLTSVITATGDPVDPETGTLYTAVSMDIGHKSDQFFTPGSRVTDERGTYYNFSGWRYVWQPLRDYEAPGTSVSRTTTSLSIVWYDYYGTSGLSGQLMLSGSDSGVSYLTTQEIVNAFDSASFSSKFTMIFNGIDMNVYIKINPWAIQFGGMSVADAFNNGFWSLMITSPAVTSDASGFTISAFSPDRVLEIVIGLLTFSMDAYGLSGVASMLCSIFFTISLYTSLLAISLEKLHLLILMGILGVIQGLSILL